MYINITRSMFHDAFRDYDMLDNFSYEAREALFDYIEQFEDDTGEKIELDVIALCCDYCEDPIIDVLKNYNLESLEELKNETMVIWNNDENVLYANY